MSLLTCAGCGLPMGSADRLPSQAMLDHVRECEKHPLTIEIATLKLKIKALMAALENVTWEITPDGLGCFCPTDPRPEQHTPECQIARTVMRAIIKDKP